MESKDPPGPSTVKGRSMTVRRKNVYIMFGVVVFTAIGIITVVSILLQGSTRMISELRYYSKMSCDAGKMNSPIQINECMKATCIFDPQACISPCPFGYRKNKRGCDVSCACASEGNFQGDVHFDEDSLPELSELYGHTERAGDFSVFASSVESSTKLWNNNLVDGRHKIPYQMDSLLGKAAKGAIKEALSTFTTKSCIDFIPWTDEKHSVLFKAEAGCWSEIGKNMKKSPQVLSVGDSCEKTGIVQHEVLHMLGFQHEHVRPDRDAYVIVDYDNIIATNVIQFNKLEQTEVVDLGSEYDFSSLLQFSSDMFSKNGKDTITNRVTGGEILGQQIEFSVGDIRELNSLYNCYEDKPGKWTEWGQWSLCDQTCGQGRKRRYRSCLDGSDSVKGCSGGNLEYLECSETPCPSKDGGWGKWGEYDECSNSCGGGYQWRLRECSQDDCEGSESEGKKCNLQSCFDRSLSDETSQTEGKPKPGPDFFENTEVTIPLNLCDVKTYNEWYFGDFNGDKRTDTLCINPDGEAKLAYTNDRGILTEPQWEGKLEGCLNCIKYVGDFNGDGKDDVLCKNIYSRTIAIKFTTSDGIFDEGFTDAGNFCGNDFHVVIVSDVNGDGKADIICGSRDTNIEIRINRFEK